MLFNLAGGFQFQLRVFFEIEKDISKAEASIQAKTKLLLGSVTSYHPILMVLTDFEHFEIYLWVLNELKVIKCDGRCAFILIKYWLEFIKGKSFF